MMKLEGLKRCKSETTDTFLKTTVLVKLSRLRRLPNFTIRTGVNTDFPTHNNFSYQATVLPLSVRHSIICCRGIN